MPGRLLPFRWSDPNISVFCCSGLVHSCPEHHITVVHASRSFTALKFSPRIIQRSVLFPLQYSSTAAVANPSPPTTLPPSRHPLGVLDIPSGTFACSLFACLAWLAGNFLAEEFPSELPAILPRVLIKPVSLFGRQSHRGAVWIGRQRHGRPWAGLTGSAGGACRSDCVAASKISLVLLRWRRV